MLKTKSEMAKIKHVSKQAVDAFISKHGIQPTGKKGKYPTFDMSTEPLASYIAEKRRPLPPPAAPPEPDITPPFPEPPSEILPAPPETAAGKKATTRRIKPFEQPLNDILSKKIGAEGSLSAAFYAEALEMARANRDATLIFKLAQAAEKEAAEERVREQMRLTEQAREKIALEKASALRINNELKLGTYIGRDSVKLIFGRVFTVWTSQLQPLGLKTADILSSIQDGPDRRSRFQKIIDDEVFAALENMRRQAMDTIKGL
jgi:hypothetical protein